MGWLALGDAVLCAGLLAPFMPREGVGLLVGRGLRGGAGVGRCACGGGEWIVF